MAEGGGRRAPTLVRALRHRDYRLFFVGQGISLVGTWITRVATSWLVYRLTGSVVLLGVVGFWSQIPLLVLSPPAGVLVDRWSRHRLLVVTQVLSMLQSFALAALALSGAIQVWHLLVLGAVQGVINAFDTPARQAFVHEMVRDPDDLGNAIALNSTMVNGARVVGPAIAGALLAQVGEGGCFLVDGISYIAVVASLLAMHVPPWAPLQGETHPGRAMLEGARYVGGFPPVRDLLLLVAVASTVGMPYAVLMPALATDVLHGGPHTMGWLMTASGLGALAGGVYLASRPSVVGLGRVIVVATALFGAGLVLLGLSRSIALSSVALPLVGGGFIVLLAATNTILQTIAEAHMRGRVMAFYTMAFFGTAPLGSLLAGAVADRIGVPWTLVACGLVCMVAAAWFFRRLPELREIVRPIYVARNILAPPE